MTIHQYKIFQILVGSDDCEEVNEFLAEIGERLMGCNWDFYQDGSTGYLVCRVEYVVDSEELKAKQEDEDDDSEEDEDPTDGLSDIEADLKKLDEMEAEWKRRRRQGYHP